MLTLLHVPQLLLSFAILVGSLCWVGVLVSALTFRRKRSLPARTYLPPVTLLKPVCGLEKNLQRNLRSACNQDYPTYQVIYSLQRDDDPALPVVRALLSEFGPERVSVIVGNVRVGQNGKINNLAGALPAARHDTLVISDSDVRLRPDFLRRIVGPLADPEVGAVSSFFRGCDARHWYEQLEQVTLNVDHFALAMLAHATGLVTFCFGVSIALTKRTLAEIGGFEALGDYLVEDTEMCRRIQNAGKRVVDIPYVVDTTVDLSGPAHWWQKQLYWEQNTRAALPALYGASVLLRTIPLALLLATLRGWDAVGMYALAATTLVRLVAAAAVLGIALRDPSGLRQLWLVPIKDTLSIVWFVRAHTSRSVVWRGTSMTLDKQGRLSAETRKPMLEAERLQ